MKDKIETQRLATQKAAQSYHQTGKEDALQDWHKQAKKLSEMMKAEDLHFPSSLIEVERECALRGVPFC